MYSLVKPLLFRQDPEAIHDRVMGWLAWSSQHPAVLKPISALCALRDRRLQVECLGLKFPNPVGLAAGLDKNGRAVPAWGALGFGFVEIGSVTALAQPGNDKPRLFRLLEDRALINRMGFNNEGAEAVARRLAELRRRVGALPVPLGINLGKSKVRPLEQAPQDYLESLGRLWPHGDYFVINVSSPNTPGLRALQEGERLEELLAAVTGFARAQPQSRPILLKIAPDLSWSQIDEIVGLVERYLLAGIIATNTTTSREGLKSLVNESGGLSGRPLAARALEVLKYLTQELRVRVPVISVGGIFSVEDVLERLQAGASLVQVYTGFIYEGPLLPRRLNQGLLAYLERQGLERVQDLIGKK
ncbi:quinone-dependent dihydroorotate dehydrogenase [Calidithermus roseus]|uniref:Dihydroorotate dehydrogenase (quinone) n=1 Tax=Calidithermus roseus TaxID=1644118 RepID=A0A399ET21_9DEIN|nr:quinone-dependent dihydroorotate dehydrogenase [Calidithermus roseus]RIH87754.1 Dihydroorotate dehydrogenase (quinone) [Calidithermus roseus]